MKHFPPATLEQFKEQALAETASESDGDSDSHSQSAGNKKDKAPVAGSLASSSSVSVGTGGLSSMFGLSSASGSAVDADYSKRQAERAQRQLHETRFLYRFWSDADNLRCFEDNFPQYVAAYKNFELIEKSDAARLCMLWVHGGIYTDLDVEPFANFYPMVSGFAEVSLLESPYSECSVDGSAKEMRKQVESGDYGVASEYQNALMASPPRHEFWRGMLKRVFEEDPLIESKMSAVDRLRKATADLATAT